MTTTTAAPPWRSQEYLLHLTGTVISTLGTAAAPVALAFAILDAGGSGSALGLVTAAGTAPAVLFFLLGGVVADRLPRHLVMVGAGLVSALAQALFAVVVFTHTVHVWELAVFAAMNGLAMAFYMPAAEGLLMRAVGAEWASTAFAIFRTALTGAQVIGAACGGLLVDAVGPGWVLVIDAASFAVAAALRAFIRVQGNLRPRSSLLAELREGWTEFTRHRWLWRMVIQFAVVNTLSVGAFGVLGAIATDRAHGGAQAWGLILACDAAGMVLGGLLMLRFRPRRLLVAAILGLTLTALPLAGLAAPVPLLLVCLCALLGGIGVELFGVTWMTALRQEIPADKFSRVAAYETIGAFGLTPLGAALAGPIADHLGVTTTLWLGSAVILAAGMYVLSTSDVRRLRRTQ
ncbi:MFS transporter [Actinokineospora enzanensis]|uniref:MFS transporter n=1 Tax=Actinokineospora enzanensis TaxID=155975 RepID=UPI000365A7F9|nr:MFS transporter [Actinokineospora enzanensis]